MKRLERTLTSLIISSLCAAGIAHAEPAKGGSYTLTRSVIGASGGTSVHGGDGYNVSYAEGETVSGHTASDAPYAHKSGYYAGWVGNGLDFQLAGSQIPGTGPLINAIRLGVSLNAQLRLDFTDQIEPGTLNSGLVARLVQDNLGQPRNEVVPLQVAYEPTSQTAVLSPQSVWLGNGIYDLAITTGVRNLDGLPLVNPTHLRFLTVLDPQKTNIVLQPVDAGVKGSAAQAPSANGSQAMALQIAPRALSDYAMVLMNSDPITSPSRIDPQIILDANRNAAKTGGAYMSPISIHEITAYSGSQAMANRLSEPATLSLPYAQSGGVVGGSGAVRSGSLSLWVLDEEHRLWVRMPDSQNNLSSGNAAASISRLGVFALMGQASGNAESVFVFPTPWRPNGPSAGSGVGQTGTLDGGLTFSNLPSECTITIYTVSGSVVRRITHSDTTGPLAQEKWDGLTTHGEVAASGVYLWRVESATDAKNGKLMVIR